MHIIDAVGIYIYIKNKESARVHSTNGFDSMYVYFSTTTRISEEEEGEEENALLLLLAAAVQNFDLLSSKQLNGIALVQAFAGRRRRECFE